jgi:ribonuclease R
MREHLGEEYGGVVSSVTSFGIFVTLDAMYVEGLVHITELGGEYYRFDEARQELRGERTGMRYAIGSRVQVQVSRVDLDGRRIDFRLVHEGGELISRGILKDKGLMRDENGHVEMKDKPGRPSVKRPARKVAEPMGRVSKSGELSMKAATRAGSVKKKDKDLGRKSRRRS